MELTPQVINEVEFAMARRGYDPDQVDEFLEKLAVMVERSNRSEAEMRDRVAAAERRVAEAERRAAERPERVVQAGPPAAEMSAAAEAELETLKRTLLLAQRTADAAVQEATADAARIRADAETSARTAHESTRRAVLEEIASLVATRDSMKADVDALEIHLDTQRARLTSSIADLQRLLDGPDRLAPVIVPAIQPIDLVTVDDAAAVAVAPVEAPVADEAIEADEEAWARFGAADDDADLEAGPRTQPLERIEPEGGDDVYLSELRKAMIQDTGAPDAADLGLSGTADTGRGTRFGRRR